MRKNIVAGNWKMNMTLQEGIDLAKRVNEINEGFNVMRRGEGVRTIILCNS